jgi:hypothetical protein
LKLLLVIGPTGGFGRFIIDELIRLKTSFIRIGAFINHTRPLGSTKAHLLQSYNEQGIELIEDTPGDPAVFKGKALIRMDLYLTGLQVVTNWSRF